jgi:hypothetical protein
MIKLAFLTLVLAACGASHDNVPAGVDDGDDDDVSAVDASPGAADGSPELIADAGPPPDAITLASADDGTCPLAVDTYLTGTVNDGCPLLYRDPGDCQAARVAQGLAGFWLHFSCRVSLTKVGNDVHLVSDGQPDYRSAYFQNAEPCHQTEPDTMLNPNRIATQTYSADIPLSPSGNGTMTPPGVIGFAVNGVGLFDNRAAIGDDIYQEAMTFDRCAAHPSQTGRYHYHVEPVSISYDDDHFIGVMRDGHPVYGRRDADGSLPTLDSTGGHTGPTPDSAAPIYHYHVNQQTSTNTTTGTVGQMQWFISKGMFRNLPGACDGCS